jgi:pantothenate kinase
MRGSHFTFDVEKLLSDLKEAKEKGVKDFPMFDYKIKDPIDNQVHFNKKKHKIVFVEGLFILTN